MTHSEPLTALRLYQYQPTAGRIVMPDVRCDLVWCGGHLVLTGPQTRAVPSRHVGKDVTLLQVHPLVIRRWLRVPLSQLTDAVVDVADIDRQQARTLTSLYESGRLPELVRPTVNGGGDDRMVTAMAALARGRPVAGVATMVDLSERQLERLFRDNAGLAPKMFARIVRFGRAVGLAKGGMPLALAATAAGYADQPHFSRDTYGFAGASPRSIIEHVGNVQDPVAGAY